MYFVDRNAVVVKPTEAFLTWLSSAAEDLPDLTLAQLRSNCSVYLLPQSTVPEETAAYFDSRWKEIFSGELASWDIPEDRWPQLTPYEFARFFDLEYHDMVLDLEEEELHVSPVSAGIR